jgi:hypothetical protein
VKEGRVRYLMEGSEKKMGVRRIEEPRYRAVCWFDGYRGPERPNDGWASDDLLTHRNTKDHREAVLNYSVRQIEDAES